MAHDLSDEGALDRIQAICLLWAKQEFDDREALAKIIEALERAGRPVVEG